jgi:DMSO/TMAO reductase YedYZ molybdopterin-dependent catalytic subunit
MPHRVLFSLLVCTLVWGLSGLALGASKSCEGGYSTQFVISGEVQNPTTYDKATLAALPHSKEDVTFLTKTGPQSGSFTGVLLWDLLNKAVVKTEPGQDGQFQYVEITGTDCYQVVLALGEIDPSFGGEQVLVADSENGSPLGPDTGFARLIVPGDKFGARDTYWITSIEILSGPPPHEP